MRRPLLMFALSLLVANAVLAASTLQFGPELRLADLRPGQPGGSEILFNPWVQQDGQVVAVVQRNAMTTRQTFVVHVQSDGTTDPGSLMTPQPAFGLDGVARNGDGMLAVWSTAEGMLASRADRNGTLLSPAGHLIGQRSIVSNPPIACNDARCIVSDTSSGLSSGLLLDTNGTLLATLPPFTFAVAGKHGFLVERCGSSPCSYDVLDDDGGVRTSAVTAGATLINDAIFDGSRYVVLSGSDFAGNLKLWSVDPDAGTWSTSTTVQTHVPFELSAIRGRLAWNGSIYAISMMLSPGTTAFPPIAGGPTWLGVMRIDQSFAAIDQTPRLLFTYQLITPPSLVGDSGGFVLLWRAFADQRLRMSLLHNDGAIVPAPPAGTPLFHGFTSQSMATGTASRGALLGVWTEDDGTGPVLRAARLARSGERLDATPLTLASDCYCLQMHAASNGDDFLVAWIEMDTLDPTSGRLIAAAIDSAGGFHTVLLEQAVPSTSVITLSFENGAYQLAISMPAAAEAITISTGGNVVLRDQFVTPSVSDSFRRTARFDGHRVIAVWADATAMRSIVKDVPGGAIPAPRVLMPSNSVYEYQGLAIEPDGTGGFLLILADYDLGTSADRFSRYVARLSGDGALLNGPKGGLLSRGLFTGNVSLVRIGGSWYATWIDDQYTVEQGNRDFRVLIPLDSATLAPGAPINLPFDLYNTHIVPGSDGEALLLFDQAIPTDLGPASGATMRSIIAGRARTVRH